MKRLEAYWNTTSVPIRLVGAAILLVCIGNTPYWLLDAARTKTWDFAFSFSIYVGTSIPLYILVLATIWAFVRAIRQHTARSLIELFFVGFAFVACIIAVSKPYH